MPGYPHTPPTPPKTRPPKPGPNYTWNGKRWVKKPTPPPSGGKPGGGNKPPRTNYPPPTPRPTGPDPMYSTYFGMAPTFRWGGRSWGADNQGAFEQYLRSKGINPATWYRNHPNAAKSFDPMQQAMYGTFNPQLVALDAERKKQQEYYQHMMGSLTNMASALMPYLQQVPQVIAGAYEQGAAADTLLGEGYGRQFDVNQDANASGQNAFLSAINQAPGVAGSNDSDVVSSLGGGLEAEILKKAGPAYANAAAQWPKQANLEAQAAMNDLLHQATQAGGDIDTEIQKVLSGLPAFQQDYRRQEQAYQLDLRNQRLREISQAEEAAYKNWYIARMNKNDKEAAYWKRQQNILEKQRIALSQGNLDARNHQQQVNENKAMGLNANGTKPLPGYKWKNPKDHSQGTVKVGSGKDGGGLREGETPAYIRTKASGSLQSWIKSHTTVKYGKPVANYTYDQAFQYLYHTYAGYVKTSFKSEAEYRKMIENILAANGVTRGGK